MDGRIILPAAILAGAVAAGGVILALGVTADRGAEDRLAPVSEVVELRPAPGGDLTPAPDEAPADIVLPAPGQRAGRDAPPLRDLRAEAPPRLLIPVQGVTATDLRQDWGDARSGGRTHQGLDILAPRGTPVLAADSGTVLKFFDSVAGGTTIYQSDSSGDLVLYYAHLEARAEGLSEGDAVKAGQIIGYVGTSGNAPANAPHLHFETALAPADGAWHGGQAVDPYVLLTGEAAGAKAP